MRLPNGDGTVYKVSGNRRKPFCARITTGWKIQNGKEIQVRKVIGYYTTKLEALNALAEFKKNPYDLDAEKITFSEVYDKWSERHFQTISQSNVNAMKASYKLCTSIYDMPIQTIKLSHLQGIVDNSGKNTPTLRKLKIMLSLVFEYAVRNEIVTPDKRDLVKYIDISAAGNPNAYDRRPFTKKEIQTLWKHQSNNYVSVILMLIYSGCRIGELLDLKKSDVHIEDRYFYIRQSKTESGIREVPIADKTMPFFQKWMQTSCDYLISTEDQKRMTYRNYYDVYWTPIIESIGLHKKLTPHCTRHTCVTLLTESRCDERILKQIVGHKGQNVTEAVYTHVDLPAKLEEINKI